jgi:hypothetical protein
VRSLAISDVSKAAAEANLSPEAQTIAIEAVGRAREPPNAAARVAQANVRLLGASLPIAHAMACAGSPGRLGGTGSFSTCRSQYSVCTVQTQMDKYGFWRVLACNPSASR